MLNYGFFNIRSISCILSFWYGVTFAYVYHLIILLRCDASNRIISGPLPTFISWKFIWIINTIVFIDSIYFSNTATCLTRKRGGTSKIKRAEHTAMNGAPTEVMTPDMVSPSTQANSSWQTYPLPAFPWQELLTWTAAVVQSLVSAAAVKTWVCLQLASNSTLTHSKI